MALIDQYVPTFVISVGGKELRHGIPYDVSGSAVDVLSLTVTDTINQADSFSFTVRDRHPEPGRFAGGADLKWIDSPAFKEGNHVGIQFGYQATFAKAEMRFEFEGQITAVSISFPESGVPTLTVRGFSYYHLLQRKQRREPFKSVTDSKIAELIAQEMGWDGDIDPTDVTHDLISTGSQTMEKILKDRAGRIGFEVAVKKKMLLFKEPGYLNAKGPAVTFEWGRDLRSFSPNLSTYGMITESTVRSSQTGRGKGKEPLVGQAKAGDIRVNMGNKNGPQIAESIQDWGKAPKLEAEKDVTTQEEAFNVARAQLEAKALGFISGRGAINGDASLRARMLIELLGLGRRFSGNYYVTSVTHAIDASGFRTDFEVKRNARNESG